MPDGVFRSCDGPECGKAISETAPCFRLSYSNIVMPDGNPALVTGFPEEDLGVFCSVRCLRQYAAEMSDSQPAPN